MKKMIASDFDRTFYLDDEDIENNKETVKEFKKAGNFFIIATGRSYYHFMKKVKEYNLEFDFAILNHGATIIDKDLKVLYNEAIDNEIIPKIKDDLQLEQSTDWFCCSQLETNVSFEHPNLTKINVRYKTKKESLKMNEYVNNKYSKYVTSYNITSSSIEIITNKTNKSKAIKLLADKLNIDYKNIYTIGDGETDIQMVKDFNGFCMKDSVKDLKKVAKKEYDSVSQLIKDII